MTIKTEDTHQSSSLWYKHNAVYELYKVLWYQLLHEFIARLISVQPFLVGLRLFLAAPRWLPELLDGPATVHHTRLQEPTILQATVNAIQQQCCHSVVR